MNFILSNFDLFCFFKFFLTIVFLIGNLLFLNLLFADLFEGGTVKMFLKLLLFILIIVCRVDGYAYFPNDMPLSDLLLILAHNSAQNKDDGWIYAQQKGNLEKQWNAGARGAKLNLHWYKPRSKFKQVFSGVFNIGVSKKKKRSKPYIALAHESDGKTNCFFSVLQKWGKLAKAEDYLRKFVALLKKNPKAVSVIILEDYLQDASEKNNALIYTKAQRKEKLHEMLKKSGMAQYAFKLNNNHASGDWPTVGELRKSNKRVILLTNSYYHASNSPYLNFSPRFLNTTHWEYDWRKDLYKRCKLFNTKKTKAFLVVHGSEISIPKGSKSRVLLRVINKIKPIKAQGFDMRETDYGVFNSEHVVKNRLNDCLKTRNIQPSLLLMDYIEISDKKGKAVKNTIEGINKERIRKFTKEKENKKRNDSTKTKKVSKRRKKRVSRGEKQTYRY